MNYRFRLFTKLIKVVYKISIFDDNVSSVLLHPLRRQIYSMVVQTPGANFSKISDLLKTSNSTLLWHLNRLEKSGYLKSIKISGKRIYYPASLRSEIAEEIIQILANETAQKILLYVVNNPIEQCYPLNIARNIIPPIHHETVRYHIDRMKNAGLVEITKEGKNVFIKPGPEAFRLKEHGTQLIKEEYVQFLMKNIKDECLFPEIVEQTDDRLVIRIDCPGGEEVILDLALSDWGFQNIFGDVEE